MSVVVLEILASMWHNVKGRISFHCTLGRWCAGSRKEPDYKIECMSLEINIKFDNKGFREARIRIGPEIQYSCNNRKFWLQTKYLSIILTRFGGSDCRLVETLFGIVKILRLIPLVVGTALLPQIVFPVVRKLVLIRIWWFSQSRSCTCCWKAQTALPKSYFISLACREASFYIRQEHSISWDFASQKKMKSACGATVTVIGWNMSQAARLHSNCVFMNAVNPKLCLS